jgi:hypothetical protein
MTKQDLKEMISEIIKAEFKRYIPLLIKEIRTNNKPILNENSNRIRQKQVDDTTSSVDLANLDWIKSMVGTEPIPQDVTMSNDVVAEAVNRDYSSLLEKMAARPLR